MSSSPTSRLITSIPSSVWSDCILPCLTMIEEVFFSHSIYARQSIEAPANHDTSTLRRLLRPGSRIPRRLRILLTQSHCLLESHFGIRIDFDGEQDQTGKSKTETAPTTNEIIPSSIDRDVWRVKQLNSQPFALNFLRLWRRNMTFNYQLQDENVGQSSTHQVRCEELILADPLDPADMSFLSPTTDPEFDWQWLFDPAGMGQLRSGLLLDRRTITLIQQSEVTLHSESTSQSAIDAMHLLLPLLQGLSRLMSVHFALTSIDAYFSYNNFLGLMDQPNRVAGFHITPFAVRWPTTIVELYQLARIVRKTNMQFLSPEQDYADAVDNIPMCETSAAKGDSPSPCAVVPYQVADWSEQREIYVCSNVGLCECDCSKESNGIPPSMCSSCGRHPIPGGLCTNLCMCHMHVLRGCAWWHCARGSNLIRQLLLHQLGLSTRCIRNPLGVSAWCGTRGTGWSRFFGIHKNINSETGEKLAPINPLETLYALPNINRYGPLPECILPLLDATLPWSIDVCTDSDPTYSPLPMFVAAPLSEGWIGGFIGSCTWPPEN